MVALTSVCQAVWLNTQACDWPCNPSQ
ncbi:hypothetical protein F383_24116 [Gossypium arboreum]|uniref:Uncharacterized protein n=1 Tax=Gossypium arboreum TaxID=29729 RepID=A0A0B0MTM7_GOSAR|nr:hypothetical protein F383_24116 [Gossypium arboreum]